MVRIFGSDFDANQSQSLTLSDVTALREAGRVNDAARLFAALQSADTVRLRDGGGDAGSNAPPGEDPAEGERYADESTGESFGFLGSVVRNYGWLIGVLAVLWLIFGGSR